MGFVENAAVFVCATVPITYIGSLYLFDWKGRNRDDPASIKRRALGVLTACTVSLCLTSAVLRAAGQPVLLSLGLRLTGLAPAVLLPTVLTVIFFAGPLAVDILCGHAYDWLSLKYWTEFLSDWSDLRHCLIAPLTEEVAFRACVVALLRVAVVDAAALLWATPVVFALCHVHHVIGRVMGGHSLLRALIEAAFQTAYTYVFGIYVTFLLMRTGHLASCVAAHSFCNFMGFPDLVRMLTWPDVRQRVFLLLALVAGVAGWTALLFPLTEPNLYE